MAPADRRRGFDNDPKDRGPENRTPICGFGDRRDDRYTSPLCIASSSADARYGSADCRKRIGGPSAPSGRADALFFEVSAITQPTRPAVPLAWATTVVAPGAEWSQRFELHPVANLFGTAGEVLWWHWRLPLSRRGFDSRRPLFGHSASKSCGPEAESPRPSRSRAREKPRVRAVFRRWQFAHLTSHLSISASTRGQAWRCSP